MSKISQLVENLRTLLEGWTVGSLNSPVDRNGITTPAYLRFAEFLNSPDSGWKLVKSSDLEVWTHETGLARVVSVKGRTPRVEWQPGGELYVEAARRWALDAVRSVLSDKTVSVWIDGDVSPTLVSGTSIADQIRKVTARADGKDWQIVDWDGKFKQSF